MKFMDLSETSYYWFIGFLSMWVLLASGIITALFCFGVYSIIKKNWEMAGNLIERMKDK